MPIILKLFNNTPMSLGKWKSKSDRYVESYDIDWEMSLDQHTLDELYYLNWVFFGIEYNELMCIWNMESLETFGDEGNGGRYIDYEQAYGVATRREKKINRILGAERAQLIGEFAITDMVDWKKFDI